MKKIQYYNIDRIIFLLAQQETKSFSLQPLMTKISDDIIGEFLDVNGLYDYYKKILAEECIKLNLIDNPYDASATYSLNAEDDTIKIGLNVPHGDCVFNAIVKVHEIMHALIRYARMNVKYSKTIYNEFISVFFEKLFVKFLIEKGYSDSISQSHNTHEYNQLLLYCQRIFKSQTYNPLAGSFSYVFSYITSSIVFNENVDSLRSFTELLIDVIKSDDDLNVLGTAKYKLNSNFTDFSHLVDATEKVYKIKYNL